MKFFKIFVALCVLNNSLSASPKTKTDTKEDSKELITLEVFLNLVKNKNSNFKNFSTSKEASFYKMKSGDLVLSSALTLSGSYLSDKKQPNQLYAVESVAQKYSMGWAKKFSSGTSLKVSADLVQVENKGIQSPVFAPYAMYSTSTLGVSLTQSLMKDFFGAATDLRHEREELQYELDLAVLSFQEKQQLVEAESLFWDTLYLEQEVKQRESSLERAQKIESWIQRRFKDGIADKADYMNAKALKANRELQLISSVDDLKNLQQKTQDFLELKDQEELPHFKGDLNNARRIDHYLVADLNTDSRGKNVRIQRSDLILSEKETKIKEKVFHEVKDSMKSDLQLIATYNTNGYDTEKSAFGIASELTKTSTPTSSIGLIWTYLLDGDVKDATVLNAEKEFKVSEVKYQRKKLESDSGWSELSRRYMELSRKIQAMEKVTEFQRERAKAEQDKLSKGRSVTSQVITSEQEASDSELLLLKLKTEHRKLETQGLLFAISKE